MNEEFVYSFKGSPLSNSYLSDQEPSSPTLAMQAHYHPQYRTTNPNNRGRNLILSNDRFAPSSLRLN